MKRDAQNQRCSTINWRVLPVVVAALLLAVPGVARSQSASDAFSRLVTRDYEGARAIAEPLAAAGDRDAQHIVGFLDERGLAGPKNLARALEFYARAAQAGSPDAQFALGELAYYGDGVKRDVARAAGWYALAAAQKHARAQVQLGRIRMSDEAGPPDPAHAASLFESAARADEAEGQFLLGIAYMTGQGRKEDRKVAAEWLARAAVKGHADAAYNLAILYDSGTVKAPKGESAGEWMARAAIAELPEAMVALGLMLHDGRADRPGETPADWFEKAANAGDAQGQFLFAVALAEGDGRPADPRGALLWVDRALAVADELPTEAKLGAERLRARLSSSAQNRPPIRP